MVDGSTSSASSSCCAMWCFQDLAACTDADGNALVTQEQDDALLSFTGNFFVELVSPYRFVIDCTLTVDAMRCDDRRDSATTADFYRTFSLLEYGFNVQLARSAKLLASTGVQLSLITVHSIVLVIG